MKSFVLIAAFIVCAYSHPVENRTNVATEQGHNVTEGDMLLTDEQIKRLYKPVNRMLKNAIINPARLWPNGTVYYKLDVSIPMDEQNLIRAALWEIELGTGYCIQFSPNVSENYIFVTNQAGGCASAVGYIGIPEQRLHLGPGCMHTGHIIHEFVHALGFFHQQSTWDRDSYIKINDENVLDGKLFNFDKYENTEVNDFDCEYDYNSLMHYKADDFSKNGEPTMTALREGGEKMGEAVELSDADYAKINMLYKCEPFHYKCKPKSNK